jgi:hypothetical protein
VVPRWLNSSSPTQSWRLQKLITSSDRRGGQTFVRHWRDTPPVITGPKIAGKYRIPGVSNWTKKTKFQLLSAPEEIRTPNLLIRSQMLYPLSYGRMSLVVG